MPLPPYVDSDGWDELNAADSYDLPPRYYIDTAGFRGDAYAVYRGGGGFLGSSQTRAGAERLAWSDWEALGGEPRSRVRSNPRALRTGLTSYNLTVRDNPAVEARLLKSLHDAADVCGVSPHVCEDNLGIPRAEMPQIPKEYFGDFLAQLKRKGFTVKRGRTAVGRLKATQRDINAGLVRRVLEGYASGAYDPTKAPVVVSKDGYILDGHHRWAAMVMHDPSARLSTYRVSAPITTLLREADAFPHTARRTFAESQARRDAQRNPRRGAARYVVAQRVGDAARALGSTSRQKHAQEKAQAIARHNPGTVQVLDTRNRKVVRTYRPNGSAADFVIDPLSGKRITEADYPTFFVDSDGDHIPDVDDPQPYGPKGTATIEEVKLSDELRKLLKVRDDLQGVYDDVESDVKRFAGRDAKFLGRVKTPYSMINKLRRKRLFGAHGLTDLIGTTIVAKDRNAVERTKDAILKGALGRAELSDDFYAHPNNGYKSYHFTIYRQANVGGSLVDVPIELQLKSPRIKAVQDGTHAAYKDEDAVGSVVGALFALADKADTGDRSAARIIDRVLEGGPGGVDKMIRHGAHVPAEIMAYARAPQRDNPAKKRRKRGDIQSLVFKRSKGWTPTTAREWAASHGYKSSNALMDVTPTEVRIRQEDPDKYSTIRAFDFSKAQGISATYGVGKASGKARKRNPSREVLMRWEGSPEEAVDVSELLEANEGDDEVEEAVRAVLEEGRTVHLGGGASPRVRLRPLHAR